MINHPNRKPRRLEIGATVEVKTFPGDIADQPLASKRGKIIGIGRDCGGYQYQVEFETPVSLNGEEWLALPFHGPNLKVLANQLESQKP
jgi:hypothetical protein